MRGSKFHGRFEGRGQDCHAPGCSEAGEFRAPGTYANSFDGPGDSRWFCLDHIREFNAGYDWFEGMSADEIFEAQSPIAGWRTENNAFRGDAGIDGMPRWADYSDPLDAISGRAASIKARAGQNYQATRSKFDLKEQEALKTMGLSDEIDRQALRRRYSELVRQYHPDRNGGDRGYETRLGKVVDAYQLLKKSAVFC
ncbi:J domain-containing protein [Pontixanthobacter gangjinensis]|uniref:DnaJ domain-containing protein n=1 Tax=Pontixanthobacter gangjinensis TaxID=1028742 RepID=A0A6I4SNH0_9SPHN|nr:J domain-containing protein [Pontixanthobacter gangjinensis]MXO57461.1 DnaJ domain-containing protein [Pontixanthobacter gangjinensis]